MNSKLLNIIILTFCLLSCTGDPTNTTRKSSDTLQIKYSEYSRTRFEGFKYLTLIKTEKSDTIIFDYYDSSGVEFYDRLVILKKNQNQFELLSYMDLVHVKDYLVFDSLLYLKYEIKNPHMDGDGGVLINPIFGDFGGYSYTWENRGFLKQWGNIEFPDTLHKVLMTDSISWPYYYMYGEGKNKEN